MLIQLRGQTEIQGCQLICLLTDCSASFSTADLLHQHVATNILRSGAVSSSQIGSTQTHPYDRIAGAGVNFPSSVSDILQKPETSNTHTSLWSRTTQSSRIKDRPTCADCGLTFSRTADLTHYLGIHQSEKYKYYCVVKNLQV